MARKKDFVIKKFTSTKLPKKLIEVNLENKFLTMGVDRQNMSSVYRKQLSLDLNGRVMEG